MGWSSMQSRFEMPLPSFSAVVFFFFLFYISLPFPPIVHFGQTPSTLLSATRAPEVTVTRLPRVIHSRHSLYSIPRARKQKRDRHPGDHTKSPTCTSTATIFSSPSMLPSLVNLGTAVLALSGNAAAAKFALSETYDSTNFFDKFNFFDKADPNNGHVWYQNRQSATSQGLVKIQDKQVYLGVDTKTVLPGANNAGRKSVRLESKTQYKRGLFIARFTHLPAKRCGTWPAFWMLGADWPNGGEVDMYEGWNNVDFNQPALHTGSSAKYGQCLLDGAGQSSSVLTKNCDNTFQSPPSQYLNQGCTAAERNAVWGNPSGGTYAVEWTLDYIKLYSWTRGKEPANIGSSQPDTATWGTPSVFLKNKSCNIDRHFGSQRLIINITFCGNPAGTDVFWKQSCAAVTKQKTCIDYVSKYPGDFKESYFKVQDIRYFKEVTKKARALRA